MENETEATEAIEAIESKGMKFCSNCGKEIDEKAEICPNCGVRAGSTEVSIVKNPGVAAVMSFFVMGLGQIYNGEIAKGLIFIVLYMLSFLAMIILIGFVTTPILWAYGIYDAHKTATRINEFGA